MDGKLKIGLGIGVLYGLWYWHNKASTAAQRFADDAALLPRPAFQKPAAPATAMKVGPPVVEVLPTTGATPATATEAPDTSAPAAAEGPRLRLVPDPNATPPEPESPTVDEPASAPELVTVMASQEDLAELNTPKVQSQMSAELRKTINAVMPDVTPFDKLAPDAQSLLLRGYAADYVLPKGIPDDLYEFAVEANAKTGLPIGWTQLLIARGANPRTLVATATAMIESFEPAARALAEQTPAGEPLDLAVLKAGLFDKFAPIQQAA